MLPKPAVAPNVNAEESAEASAAAPAKTGIGPMLRKRWWLVLLVGWLVADVVGVLYYCLRSPAETKPVVESEFDLGSFRFQIGSKGNGTKGSFALHVSLKNPQDKAAMAALVSRRFRIQQSVEELMRGANESEFEDPRLLGLKRLIGAQINETSGRDLLGEVILTDLHLERHEASASVRRPSADVATHEAAQESAQ